MEVIEFGGLEITLARLALEQGQRWNSTAGSGLWCSVITHGIIATSLAALGDWTWTAKTVLHYRLEEPLVIEHLAPRANEISGVFIRIPLDRIDGLLAGAGIAAGGAGLRIWREGATANALAWQMLGCPLSGGARRLYLSGKALELLSLAGDGDAAAAVKPARAGRPAEIERVHAARAHLLANLREPPSVPELARTVGLNARRLGELFREAFGTSVYAFAKKARFDQAKLLLEAGETTVSQVAYRYGYQPSHFSTQFRRRFGCAPSTLAKRPERLPD